MLFIKRNLASQLTELFKSHASSFNGCYNGINRILGSDQTTNTKALEEFYKRISFIDGYKKLSEKLTRSYPSSKLTPKKTKELCDIMNAALSGSGVYHSDQDRIVVLTSDTVLHYESWDGEELYVDSKVKVIFPAWYQDNKLIEKGYCTSVE